MFEIESFVTLSYTKILDLRDDIINPFVINRQIV